MEKELLLLPRILQKDKNYSKLAGESSLLVSQKLSVSSQ